MKSLARTANIARLRDRTLTEIMTICSSSTVDRNVCFADLDSIRDLLEAALGMDLAKVLFNSRQDLDTVAAWYNHLLLLTQGVAHEYLAIVDAADVVQSIEPLYNRGDHIANIPFKISGLVPDNNMIIQPVHIMVERDFGYRQKSQDTENLCIVYPLLDEETWQRMATAVAHKILIMTDIQPDNEVSISWVHTDVDYEGKIEVIDSTAIFDSETMPGQRRAEMIKLLADHLVTTLPDLFNHDDNGKYTLDRKFGPQFVVDIYASLSFKFN